MQLFPPNLQESPFLLQCVLKQVKVLRFQTLLHHLFVVQFALASLFVSVKIVEVSQFRNRHSIYRTTTVGEPNGALTFTDVLLAAEYL